MALELFRQILLDNFFEFYFYVMSSSSYEFYLAIFYNLLAVFYFILMLYVLNVVTFLRYNFLNDIFAARWLRFFVRLSFNVSKDEYEAVLRELAFYGYLILTGLEVLIKSSFIIIIGWFSFKLPYINFDPEPSASWRFADFFSKSRFYIRRPVSSQSAYYRIRGYDLYSVSDAYDRGSIFKDLFRSKSFIQFQDPYTHLAEELENPSNSVWSSFRYRQRLLLFERARILSNRHHNWSAHIGGSRLDQGYLSEISVPRHLYETSGLTFFRPKSLEFRPLNDVFSPYYRPEDMLSSFSSRRRFLSRFWVPGKTSKTMTLKLFRGPRDTQEKKMRMHNRERPINNLHVQIWGADNVDPYLIRHAAKVKKKKLDQKELESLDPFGAYKEELRSRVSDRAKIRWNDYNQLLNRYDSSLDAVDGEDFNFYYDESEEIFEKELNVFSFYFSYGGENTVFDPEEVEFRRYLRRLANFPTEAENRNFLTRSRFQSPHTHDIMARKPLMEETTAGWHSSESKTKKSIYSLRGTHIYRRSLLDFVGVGILKLFRRSTDFVSSRPSFKMHSPFNHESVMSEDIFGVTVDDLERSDKIIKEASFDNQIKPLFWRGRQDLSSLYGSAGNGYDLLRNSTESVFWRDRPGNVSFLDAVSAEYSETADQQFAESNRDRLLVNRGFIASSRSKTHDPLFRKVSKKGKLPVYDVGDYSFYFQFVRLVYRFASDHLFFWFRALLNYFGISGHYLPARLASFRPGFESDRKSLPFFLMRVFYFFRKLFRVLVFRGLSLNNPFSKSERLEVSPFGELEDFTKQVLFRTFSSFFFRVASVCLAFLACTLNSAFDLCLSVLINHTLAVAVVLAICGACFFRLYKPKYHYTPNWFKYSGKRLRAKLKDVFVLLTFPARAFWRIVRPVAFLTNRRGHAAWYARNVGEDEATYQSRISGLYVDSLKDLFDSLRKTVFSGPRSSVALDDLYSKIHSRSTKVFEYLALIRQLFKSFFLDCALGIWYFLVIKLLLGYILLPALSILSTLAKWLFYPTIYFHNMLFGRKRSFETTEADSVLAFSPFQMRLYLLRINAKLLPRYTRYVFWVLLGKFVYKSLHVKAYRRTDKSSDFMIILIDRLRAYIRVVLVFFRTKILRRLRFKIEETMWNIRSWFDS